MSRYLTIRSDPQYSREAATGPLTEFLGTLPELAATNRMEFRNAPGSPWVCVVLARADGSGNYATEDRWLPAVNVVELVCGDGDEEWYVSLAGRVAQFLGWEAVEEHSERKVWPLS
jgi:hypothetical protein